MQTYEYVHRIEIIADSFSGAEQGIAHVLRLMLRDAYLARSLHMLADRLVQAGSITQINPVETKVIDS